MGWIGFSSLVLLLLLLLPILVLGGDIVHEDDEAPKQPGCSNNFVLVKVQTWIGNNEGNEFVGVGARFGPPIVSKEKYANRSQLAISDPPECCTRPRNKLVGEVLIVHRGKCKFTTVGCLKMTNRQATKEAESQRRKGLMPASQLQDAKD